MYNYEVQNYVITLVKLSMYDHIKIMNRNAANVS